MLVRLIITLIIYSFSTLTSAAENNPQQTPLGYGPVSYANAVEKAAPAVVSIQTTKHIPIEQHPLLQDPFFRFRFFGDQDFLDQIPEQEQLQQGLGSGVIINSKGYILTNNHVIKGADSIVVKLPDGRSIEAAIIGTDPQTDLAVLKINLKNLPVINLGISSKIRVGDVTLAIGNPFGIERTVTQGIVSATGSISARTTEKVVASGLLDNLIQTDAAINPGNSGGALIDAYGNLIGINMAIISKTGAYNGIGFAIPIDTAKEVMTQLIEKGHITRGWLGAYLSDLNIEIQQQLNFKSNEGVYIQGTFNTGPAKRAGILPGDIIVKINGISIKNSANAIKIVSELQPGKPYPIEIFRKGNYMSFSVVIGERPKEK
jgi:Do/DeqQ family serine protease